MNLNISRPGNTLHEAMKIVLEKMPELTASTQRISDLVYEKNLYRKQDGGKAEDWQIFLRARQYPEMFEVINKGTIKLNTD